MDVNFDNMIDNLPEAVFCTDDKRYFIQVNKIMIERLGRTHQELTDMRLDDVIPAEDKHEIMKHYIKVLNGLNSSVETKFLTNVVDEYLPVELTSIYKEIDYTTENSDTLQTSDDKGYVLTVARDITTERKLEEEIKSTSSGP
jgi:PAS domain S-box-containing protein